MKKTFLILSLALYCHFGLANTTNSSEAAKKTILHLLDSAVEMAKSDKMQAEKLVLSAKSYSENIGYEFGVSRSLFSMGYINQVNGKKDTGIIYFMEAAAKLAKLEDDKSTRLNIITNRKIASIFHDHYKFKKAIEFFEKSNEIAVRLNSEVNENLIKNNYLMALSFRKSSEFTKAIEILFEASELALDNNNYKYLTKINHQLGMLFKDIKEYDKSRDHHFEVFRYKNKIKNFDWHGGRAYHNIANTYMEEGDSTKSEEYYRKAIASKLATGNPKNAFISYMDYAELLMLQGKFEEAKNNYEAALASNVVMEGNPNKFKIYKQLSTLSMKQNDSQAYMKYNLLYTAFLEDDLTKNKNLIETDQQYNIQLVTERYYELIETKRREEMYKQWAIMAAAFVLLSIMGYFAYAKIKSIRLRKILEKELREAMVDINLEDL